MNKISKIIHTILERFMTTAESLGMTKDRYGRCLLCCIFLEHLVHGGER